MIALFTAAMAMPLVHDGDAAAALAAVSPLVASPLEAVSMRDLSGRPAVAVGATLRRCAREPVPMAIVRADLSRAEAARAAADAVAVADHLDLALTHLGCLTDIADGPTAASVFLLRAALEVDADRPDAARSELATALSFHPDATWPATYPVAGAALLTAVRDDTARVTLSIAPAALTGPWLDGHEVAGSAAVRPGLHLAQHSGRGGPQAAWLVLGNDGAWLIPEALAPSALDAYPRGDPSRAATDALLTGLFPDGAVVWHQGGVWEVRDGASVQLRAATPPPPPAPTKGRRQP
jgi:hypothetical protein